MKKLFFCVMAIAIASLCLTSCKNDKSKMVNRPANIPATIQTVVKIDFNILGNNKVKDSKIVTINDLFGKKMVDGTPKAVPLAELYGNNVLAWTQKGMLSLNYPMTKFKFIVPEGAKLHNVHISCGGYTFSQQDVNATQSVEVNLNNAQLFQSILNQLILSGKDATIKFSMDLENMNGRTDGKVQMEFAANINMKNQRQM